MLQTASEANSSEIEAAIGGSDLQISSLMIAAAVFCALLLCILAGFALFMCSQKRW